MLKIIYEDDDLIVVNKPKGLLVHPTSYNEKNTLVDLLRNKIKCNEFEDQIRPGIIQRLDKNTNGLMLIAKTKKVASNLIKQMNEGILIRKYLAIVHNDFKDDVIIIKAPIAREKNKTLKMVVSSDAKAKEAVTKIKVIKHFNNASYIECELETGRTHQIRVHMNYLHHPIFNDSLYGHDDGYNDYGPFLTSYYLRFEHPTQKIIKTFKINPDMTFKKLLKELDK